jgi:hypothetical protein
VTTREEQEAIWSEVYARMTADERRVADDISARGMDNARQQLQWAEELFALVEVLTVGAAVPRSTDISMFWVRFHGVVTEMVDFNRQPAEWARAMTPDERGHSLTRFSLAIFDAARAMLEALAEDELVVADYLRQRAVHLRQSAYALRLTKRREVRETRTIDQLGKTFTIEEFDRMRANVQARHGSDDRFARYVAERVRAGAQRIVVALRELHALPASR